MPKYNVNVGFSLTTEINPEFGRYAFEGDGIEDFEESSYFSAQPVEVDGGEITFTVETEDEDAAERRAEEVIAEGMEVEDDNGFTWIVERVSIDIEPVEEPMTLARASELVTKFMAEYPSMNPELKEAILFLLRLISEPRIAMTGSSHGMAEDSTIANRS